VVDLHIHTTHSDGSKTVREILETCERLKMKAISFTDHDELLAYKDLQNPEIRGVFSGKIINGVEITTTLSGVPVEILAYGIDLKIMEKNMIMRAVWKCQVDRFNAVVKILKKHGIKNMNEKTDWVRLFREIKQTRPEVCEKYDEMSRDYVYFFRKGIANPKSVFYINSAKFFTPFEKVIKNVHKAGGVAILAHPYEYHENRERILEYAKDKVDGIECYHPTAETEAAEGLVQFCKSNNLLVSGGSDFHGTPKPNNWLGFTYAGAEIDERNLTVLGALHD
jgi:predicted metal-dependent phosphoesterase TrpH